MGEITIKDIARICNVGVSTVSRAINNHSDITEDTKKRIMDAIQEYGYVPNNSARNLKRTDGKCIAILVKGMTNPFFSGMIRVMTERIQQKKYTVVMRHVEFDEDEVEIALELVKEKRLRGIVFLGGHFHSMEMIRKIQVPFVLSTSTSSFGDISCAFYSSIAVDDCKEGYRMTEYLIRQGHRRIAIMTALGDDSSIGHLRLQGYLRALEEHQIEADPELIRYMKSGSASFSMENGYTMTQEMLALGIDFDAIFAVSDRMAIGACRALYENGKRVPEDVSVCGFDGLEMGDYIVPSITTIKQPAIEMAEKTMEQLFNVIDGISDNRHIVFEAQLLEKESVKNRNEEI